jgi:hypothetical protein
MLPCAAIPRGLKVNFRVAATETGNIGLEADLIEPAEHLIELFAQEKLHHRHGKLLGFHRPAQNTAENLCCFGIG